MWNFFVVMITPVLINRIGWKTYLIFMSTSFSFAFVIYFFYPETSNYSLEEIDEIFLKMNEDYHPEEKDERREVVADHEEGSRNAVEKA